MSDDTISRQETIDFIDAGRLVNPNEPRWSDNEVVAFLKSRPSAERRGRWERRGYHLHCSCCDWSADLATPHCPGCGAYLGGDV